MTRYFWAAFALVFVLVIIIERLRARIRKSRHRKSLRHKAQPAKGEIVSVILLLKLPRELDQAAIAATTRRVFPNVEFEIRPIKNQFALRLPDMMLGIINASGTYFTDPGEVASHINDFALKSAVQDHTAWMSIDLMSQIPTTPQHALRAIGKLLAEFAGNDVLA